MRRLRRWLMLGGLGCAAVPACGDAFGIEDVLGIWNTESINNYAVPGTVVYQGDRVDTLDTQYVRWVFYQNGLCTLTQQVEGSTTSYDECEYAVDPEQRTITMLFQLRTWDGSVEGNRMTLTDPHDMVWVLRAQ
jgi:hypothetical protein